jgi:hypothetical protein
MAGVPLERAVHWIQYAKATIPGVEGEWIANMREWWMQEAQLSYDQFDRASRLLRKMGLIEKRQWWFASFGLQRLHKRSGCNDGVQQNMSFESSIAGTRGGQECL